jgi:spore maturation protein CgeB
MTLDIVMLGLSLSSSWGNGHATTYRSLIKALAARGHRITFLERDVAWYRAHRDLSEPSYCQLHLYEELRDVPLRHGTAIAESDLVILGSYVPDGAALGDWITRNARGITAFYDIDTPVTLARLEQGIAGYIGAALIPRFDLYLSFTGGPVLDLIEGGYGSPRARALYCAVDPDEHRPAPAEIEWALGYLGTYSPDRQPTIERLLVEPARLLADAQFVVAGPQYPTDLAWPPNVARIEHLPPADHPRFYCAQRYTLNATRSDMIAAGFSPSVRLFEAAACGVPIISDSWPGLDTFFVPGQEILVAQTPEDIVQILHHLPEERRRMMAAAARKRVLHSHTAAHRARQLENYYHEAVGARREKRPAVEAVA